LFSISNKRHIGQLMLVLTFPFLAMS